MGSVMTSQYNSHSTIVYASLLTTLKKCNFILLPKLSFHVFVSISNLITLFMFLAMAMALIDVAYDVEHEVRDIIATSLVELGKKQPELLLTSCLIYLQRHTKVT